MKPLVVFGEDWQSHPSSTQHLFKRVARQEPVIWFNSVGMRSPTLNRKDMARVWQKLLKVIKPIKTNHIRQSETTTEPETLLNEQNAPVLPWHQFEWVQHLNQNQVSKKLASLIPNNDGICYWVSVPTAISLIEIRPQDSLIYYCGDDFSALAGVDSKMVAPLEQRLIEQADIIFVASNTLAQKMPAEKTVLLEHGVDFELFNQNAHLPAALAKKEPEQITKLMPKIGFYGSINQWLDLPLIKQLAKHRPQYQFVLLGDTAVDTNSLNQHSNIVQLPAVPHGKLPSYLQQWSVALLPFKDTPQIRACNPLKLREYLASGVPVVSANFPAAQAYSKQIAIANSMDEYLNRIDHFVSLNSSERRLWRNCTSQVVKKQSWQAKTETVISTIAPLRG